MVVGMLSLVHGSFILTIILCVQHQMGSKIFQKTFLVNMSYAEVNFTDGEHLVDFKSEYMNVYS